MNDRPIKSPFICGYLKAIEHARKSIDDIKHASNQDFWTLLYVLGILREMEVDAEENRFRP